MALVWWVRSAAPPGIPKPLTGMPKGFLSTWVRVRLRVRVRVGLRLGLRLRLRLRLKLSTATWRC